MKKLLLLLALLIAPPWHSTDAASHYIQAIANAKSGSGACVGYTGPGDLKTYLAYYALRSYSCATRGTKLANVCRESGGADVACADMFSDATTGLMVLTSISGTACTTDCTFKIFYDLTGNGLDVTQTTVASRMAVSLNCVNTTLPCALGSGTVAAYTSGSTLSQSGAWTAQGAAMFTLTDSTFKVIINDNNASGIVFDSDNATAGLFGTSGSLTQTAAVNVWHTVQGVGNNGASSSIKVDTTAPTTGTTSGNLGTTVNLFGNGFGQRMSGKWLEAGFQNGALNSTDQATYQTNMNAYAGI